MPFIGNQPALSYTSFAKQDFTTSATTSYTLDQPVANANELALFINFVRQEPTTAYTASGTTLTLTSATSASDDMYCVFLGKAVQTVNPPNGSVDSSKINYPLTTFSSTGIDDNATSTAITIDSNDNVGIGTSSPDTSGSRKTLQISNGTIGGSIFLNDLGTGSDNPRLVGGANGTSSLYIAAGGASGIIGFETGNATERMRIGSNGYVAIGTTTLSRQFNVYSTGEPPARFQRQQGDNALRTHLEFIREGSTAGEIQCTNTSTTYATSSDYRLKENVSYDFDATTRLKQLKPARFNFIANADKTVDGFIAHEVQSVVPEAITGEKDATETKEKVVVNANGQVIAENIEQVDWEAGKIANENGNTQYPTDSTWEATKVVPVYQGIDQSKLVPLLVKTIQELEARITQLENA
jgi:hypothetical protein